MNAFKLLTALAALILAGPGLRHSILPAAPPLWGVRDADTTIYLFGSIHVLQPDIAWFGGPVRAAFDASGTVVLELAPGAEARDRDVLQRMADRSEGPPLSSQLPSDCATRLSRAAQEADYPLAALDRAAPWVVGNTLANDRIARGGYRASEGVETVLKRAAAATGKPVIGLERAADQYRAFNAVTDRDQRTELCHLLADPDRVVRANAAAFAAWRTGDTAKLADLTAQDLASAPPGLAAALIDARNVRWTNWIADRMDQPGTVFVAVGVGHLVGPGSVQTRLAAKGIPVTRLR